MLHSSISTSNEYPQLSFHQEIRKIFISLPRKNIYLIPITKTSLFKYTENFTTKKYRKKNLIFFTFLLKKKKKKTDCRYSLELPRHIDYVYSLELHQWGHSNKWQQSMFLSRNKKNNEYPCKPQFYYIYIKVGFKGVNITFLFICFHDGSYVAVEKLEEGKKHSSK